MRNTPRCTLPIAIAPIAIAAGLLAACSEQSTPTQPTPPSEAPQAGAALAVAAGSWATVAPMPTGRYFAGSGVAANSAGNPIFYVFGGYDIDDIEGIHIFESVQAYNLATNTWATKADAPSPRAAFNGVGKIGGKFYLPGGGDETGNGFLRAKSLLVYDPARDTWSLKADMPRTSSQGVSGVIDGKLYVLTGFDNVYVDGVQCEDCGLVFTRRLFRYDPVTDRWTRKTPCPHFHINGVAGVIDGKFYVTGGFEKGATSLRLDIYDPTTDSWSFGAPLPNVHSGGAGVVLGGQLYVIGGFTDEVVAYNPKTNRWTQRARFPITSRFLTASKAVLNGQPHIVAVGGLADGVPSQGRETDVFTP